MHGDGGLLGLVEQDRVWRTAEGEVVLVDSMTPRHLGAVLRVLVAMETELHGEWLDRRRAAGGAPAKGGAGGGDGGADEGDSRAWFDALALVVRIRQLLAQYNQAQREARTIAAVPVVAAVPAVAAVAAVAGA